jgi:aldehyde dehydrogenase (NAD+)
MQEEVFGPVLPVILYNDLNEVLTKFQKISKPLCIYYFSKNKKNHDVIINNTITGTVCINGTIHSIISHYLPFGGIGESGMGRYHGKASFETFSYKKAVLNKKFWWDWSVIYPPYNTSIKVLKKAFKIFY